MKTTSTGWMEDGDSFRRAVMITTPTERLSKEYRGPKDDEAFDAFVAAEIEKASV